MDHDSVLLDTSFYRFKALSAAGSRNAQARIKCEECSVRCTLDKLPFIVQKLVWLAFQAYSQMRAVVQIAIDLVIFAKQDVALILNIDAYRGTFGNFVKCRNLNKHSYPLYSINFKKVRTSR